MGGKALIDVWQYIKSKKVRIIYLENLQILKEEISNNQPYLYLFNQQMMKKSWKRISQIRILNQSIKFQEIYCLREKWLFWAF